VTSPSDLELRLGQRLRGHISLWLLALSIALFKLWLWYQNYPLESAVVLLGGLLELVLSSVAAFFNFLLGWLGLTALISIGNLRRIFIYLHRPLDLIGNTELRKFYCAPATVIFSVLLLAATLELVSSVWVVRLEAPYELIGYLPPGQNAFFLDEENPIEVSARSTTSLALRGWTSTGVLILRDKYNLRTLDAIVIRRRPLGFAIEECRLSGREASTQDGRTVSKQVSPKRLKVVGELRWSDDRVDVPMTLADGSLREGGWIRPGEAAEGPERVPQGYAQVFLERIYSQRAEVSRWAFLPSTEQVVLHRIEDYDLEIAFENQEVQCAGDDRFPVREATSLSAKEAS